MRLSLHEQVKLMMKIAVPKYYFLNEDKTINPCDLLTWAEQLENMDKRVGNDIINNRRISTVWLGLDHRYGEGEPLIFETMVFESPNSYSEIYCERYSTYDEAVIGHEKAKQWVINGCNEE